MFHGHSFLCLPCEPPLRRDIEANGGRCYTLQQMPAISALTHILVDPLLRDDHLERIPRALRQSLIPKVRPSYIRACLQRAKKHRHSNSPPAVSSSPAHAEAPGPPAAKTDSGAPPDAASAVMGDGSEGVVVPPAQPERAGPPAPMRPPRQVMAPTLLRPFLPVEEPYLLQRDLDTELESAMNPDRDLDLWGLLFYVPVPLRIVDRFDAHNSDTDPDAPTASEADPAQEEGAMRRPSYAYNEPYYRRIVDDIQRRGGAVVNPRHVTPGAIPEVIRNCVAIVSDDLTRRFFLDEHALSFFDDEEIDEQEAKIVEVEEDPTDAAPLAVFASASAPPPAAPTSGSASVATSVASASPGKKKKKKAKKEKVAVGEGQPEEEEQEEPRLEDEFDEVCVAHTAIATAVRLRIPIVRPEAFIRTSPSPSGSGSYEYVPAPPIQEFLLPVQQTFFDHVEVVVRNFQDELARWRGAFHDRPTSAMKHLRMVLRVRGAERFLGIDIITLFKRILGVLDMRKNEGWPPALVMKSFRLLLSLLRELRISEEFLKKTEKRDKMRMRRLEAMGLDAKSAGAEEASRRSLQRTQLEFFVRLVHSSPVIERTVYFLAGLPVSPDRRRALLFDFLSRLMLNKVSRLSAIRVIMQATSMVLKSTKRDVLEESHFEYVRRMTHCRAFFRDRNGEGFLELLSSDSDSALGILERLFERCTSDVQPVLACLSLKKFRTDQSFPKNRSLLQDILVASVNLYCIYLAENIGQLPRLNLAFHRGLLDVLSSPFLKHRSDLDHKRNWAFFIIAAVTFDASFLTRHHEKLFSLIQDGSINSDLFLERRGELTYRRTIRELGSILKKMRRALARRSGRNHPTTVSVTNLMNGFNEEFLKPKKKKQGLQVVRGDVGMSLAAKLREKKRFRREDAIRARVENARHPRGFFVAIPREMDELKKKHRELFFERIQSSSRPSTARVTPSRPVAEGEAADGVTPPPPAAAVPQEEGIRIIHAGDDEKVEGPMVESEWRPRTRPFASSVVWTLDDKTAKHTVVLLGLDKVIFGLAEEVCWMCQTRLMPRLVCGFCEATVCKTCIKEYEDDDLWEEYLFRRRWVCDHCQDSSQMDNPKKRKLKQSGSQSGPQSDGQGQAKRRKLD